MDRKLCRSFLTLVFFIREVHLTYYPTVFWTPTNWRFNLNKLNGEGYFIKVKYFSNMYFMCPHISIWAGKSDMSPHSRMMHENIILVDKESYKSCSIKNVTRAKTLLKCDADPVDNSAKYSKEHFASVQASPDKQCYKMGQHYYFISTSDGSAESLNHTEGGHCKTHHMKLHIYVCNENEKCEFEMPECPKEQGNNQIVSLPTSTGQGNNQILSLPTSTGHGNNQILSLPTSTGQGNNQILSLPTSTGHGNNQILSTSTEQGSNQSMSTSTEQGNNQTLSTSNCTNDSVSISAQPGVKGWFSDNRHYVLYAVMGLVIVILFVIILWLLHDNRKYRKSGTTVAKKNKNKSSIDKEVV